MKSKSFLKHVVSYFAHKTFFLWQALGLHIVPLNFYEPIPDTRTLNDKIWEKHSDLVGLDINETGQLKLLEGFMTKFKNEYDKFPLSSQSLPYEYYVNNGMYESVDGEVLYCMIRQFKPKRIMEVGSGYSTYATARAIRKNKEENRKTACEFIAIDPFPNQTLLEGIPGLSELVVRPVQRLPIQTFKRLRENDILLVDSTHVVKIGSDVQYIFLEILPRLDSGVIVAFHDVFSPAEYPQNWIMKNHMFLNEQYLLQAFLMFNDSWEVLWSSSYIHLNRPEVLEKCFKSYNRDRYHPASFWICRSTSHCYNGIDYNRLPE